MNEYMLFIKATGNPVGNLPKKKVEAHINKVGGFIQNTVSEGKMMNAQPLIPTGMMLSNEGGSFSEKPLDEKEEMTVGFYHIKAENMKEALKIAQSDPRFENGHWKMEVREIMKVEGIN